MSGHKIYYVLIDNNLHLKDHDNDGDDTEQVHLGLGLVRVDGLVRFVPPGKMSVRP